MHSCVRPYPFKSKELKLRFSGKKIWFRIVEIRYGDRSLESGQLAWICQKLQYVHFPCTKGIL